MAGRVGEHAVVVGAGVSGLVTAGALAGRFDRVTVVDRDHLPAEAVDRKGVPHGIHAHGLLVGGRLGMEELYPGLTDELLAGGGVAIDPGLEVLFHQFGALRIRFASGLLGVSLTRALLELVLRRRAAALPGVTIRDQVAVTGLRGDSERVTGVELDDVDVLSADLVVDASGRGGGRADRWLAALGFQPPQVATVKVGVGYTTRVLRHPHRDALPDGGMLLLAAPTPPRGRRVGVAFCVDDDRWVVTLGGWHNDHAPSDAAGFADFAATLPVPYIAKLLAKAEPVGDPAVWQFPASRRRYFEKLRRLPAGYVALGDAICSFNPLYGQGMTVAALEALELRRCLDRYGAATAEFGRAYYRAAGKIIDTPWQSAAGGDFMYPETTGQKPVGTDLLNRYVRRAMLAAHVDVDVYRALLDIQHLLAPPSVLLKPAMVAKVLRQSRRSPAASAR